MEDDSGDNDDDIDYYDNVHCEDDNDDFDDDNDEDNHDHDDDDHAHDAGDNNNERHPYLDVDVCVRISFTPKNS